MIERKNLLNLLDNSKIKYHSAVITCYNFEPIFFETIYLPKLKKLYVSNIIILVDASMYDILLADSSNWCHQVKMKGYQLVRQENHHGGVFHSKVIMLFEKNEAALIVGSGNITFSGMSNNEEVWNAFYANGKDSPNYPIIKNGWNYVKSLVSHSPSLVKRQIEWIEKQTEWISTKAETNVIELKSGEKFAFLFNNDEDTIINKLVSSIGSYSIDKITYSIDKITVIAPFYDASGGAIKELNQKFTPKKFQCVMDLTRQSAPFELIKKNEGIEFYKYIDKKCPLHAKIIEIQASNGNGSWILSGSANIGNMALGTTKQRYNDEACVLVYSRTNKDYIKELGLEDKIETLSDKDLQDIVQPNREKTTSSSRKLTIKSCEYKDDKLFINLSDEIVDCTLQILDVNLETTLEKSLITNNNMEVELPCDCEPHLVVFIQKGEIISNYYLVVHEIDVESYNPDSSLRKLNSLLDGHDFLKNITNILGFIEFEDTIAHKIGWVGRKNDDKKSNDESESALINKEQFNNLRHDSRLYLRHPNSQILSFLKKIFFRSDEDSKSEDELFDLQKENEGDNSSKTSIIDQDNKESNKLAQDENFCNGINNFLEKMTDFLNTKSNTTLIHDPKGGSKSMPMGKGYLPKLVGEVGLNESSSFAVATTIVAFLMKNHHKSILKIDKLRENFYKCICMFFAVYGQKFLNSIDSIDKDKKQKIHDLLKDGTIMLYQSLCYFNFKGEEYKLVLIILNSFDAWREDRSTLNEIIESWSCLDCPNKNTYSQIKKLYEIYSKEKDIPTNRINQNDNKIFLYRIGYGFFYADVNFANGSYTLTYSHPRYEQISCKYNGMTKYKGYVIDNI